MTQKKADIGGKRLISLSPEKWVEWITQKQNVEVREFIASDFQWINKDNDVLLKVYTPEEGEFLLLNELQLRYNNKLPLRMNAYAALAQERYNLPVYPVLINILPVSLKTIPSRFETEFMGLQSIQDYRVINLWEVSADLVFQQEISTLLPFVPILKGGAEESVVKKALIELRKDQTLNELEPLLSFFASFIFDLPKLQEIMRWDMTILRESPWYQEILKEGLQQGKNLGLQEGRQEGLLEGKLELTLKQLSRRFGTLEGEIRAKINQLNVKQIDDLAENIFDFNSIEDVKNWLNNF